MTAEEKLKEIKKLMKIWKLFFTTDEIVGKCADQILEILDKD